MASEISAGEEKVKELKKCLEKEVRIMTFR